MISETQVRSVEEQALEALEAYQQAKAEYDRAYEEKRQAERRLLAFFPEEADVIRVGSVAVKRDRFGSITVMDLEEPVAPREEE